METFVVAYLIVRRTAASFIKCALLAIGMGSSNPTAISTKMATADDYTTQLLSDFMLCDNSTLGNITLPTPTLRKKRLKYYQNSHADFGTCKSISPGPISQDSSVADDVIAPSNPRVVTAVTYIACKEVETKMTTER
jgi:hypothetical protein